jgi:hypothetical protein
MRQMTSPVLMQFTGPKDNSGKEIRKGLDDRGAVHRHERPLAAAPELVSLSRDQLLAGARLPPSRR